MATVLNLPQFQSVGAEFGRGLGKGLEAASYRFLEMQDEEGIRKWMDAVKKTKTREEAQAIPVPEGAVTNINDAVAIQEFINRRHPATKDPKTTSVDILTSEGDIRPAMLTPTEINVQAELEKKFPGARIAPADKKAAAGRKPTKFTLSDRQNQVLGKMIENERLQAEGQPPAHELRPTEKKMVQSVLADPMRVQAMQITSQSPEYFRALMGGDSTAAIEIFQKNVRILTGEELPAGVSEDDIKFYMDEYGWTRDEVIRRILNRAEQK